MAPTSLHNKTAMICLHDTLEKQFGRKKQSTSGLSGPEPKPPPTSKKTKTKTSNEVPKRKPVWKLVGSSNQEAGTIDPKNLPGQLDVNKPSTANEENDPSGAVRNGWYHERYDPEFITGCDSSCRACKGQGDRIAV